MVMVAPSLIKDGPKRFITSAHSDHPPLSIITLQGSQFAVNGHPFLTHVPPNITCTCASTTPELMISKDYSTHYSVGCFVGFNADQPGSRHVAPIGKLRNIRFMSLFRFKVWWTTHWAGYHGSDVQPETQMMLLDRSDRGRPYVLLLPILEGPFRCSLQHGTNGDDVDICMESGSTLVNASAFRTCLYIHTCDDHLDDPYQLVYDAVKVVRAHLGTFKLLEEKTPPRIVDKFGWCTWDAFYLKVNPQGVWEGVKELADGGSPPGFVIIDDGWQSITQTGDDSETDQEGMNHTVAGEQMPCRLLTFKENYKFRDYKSPRVPHEKGMHALVSDLKEEFKSVEDVYVWHALCGYWGGLRPSRSTGLPECRVIWPKLSEGLKTSTMEDLAVDKMVESGVGLVPPEKAHELFERLHSHLESVGIDGVKVDVIHSIEMLGEEFGGRVELAKAYYKALTASIKKHFKGNGVIASMENCNDFMYLGTEAIAVGRVGDDFWVNGPNGDPSATYWLQGLHMVHCAYNSMWMGNFIHPDWDMFQSTHPCAEFHAASRAISGGPIYVSDCIGKHNFDLLRALVLLDGSTLRCQHYALPTRDCLFADPLQDGKTVLKIWNLNKFTGVLGAFNCQGGGWCPRLRKNRMAVEAVHSLPCLASPRDIEWGYGKSPISVTGVQAFAVYSHRQKNVKLLNSTSSMEISLPPFDYELLTVSPIRILSRKNVQFAIIGLVNMLNSGGAIQTVIYDDMKSSVQVEVRGSGEMRVFTSNKPTSCKINGLKADFGYHNNMATVQVLWPGPLKFSVVEYSF